MYYSVVGIVVIEKIKFSVTQSYFFSSYKARFLVLKKMRICNGLIEIAYFNVNDLRLVKTKLQ